MEVVATTGAVSTAKPVGKDPAFQILAVCRLDMERDMGIELACLVATRQVGLQVLAHDFIQQGAGGTTRTIDSGACCRQHCRDGSI